MVGPSAATLRSTCLVLATDQIAECLHRLAIETQFPLHLTGAVQSLILTAVGHDSLAVHVRPSG